MGWKVITSNFMKNPWIFPMAALVVGAAGGYFSGKAVDVGSAVTSAAEVAQRSRSSERAGASATSESGKKSRMTSTEEINRLPGNSSRVQALLDFYGGLSAEQLAEEAAKLEQLPVSERMVASFLLFGRWAELDPTAAMAFSGTMGMAGGFVRPTILQSWASVDPANAAKYYAENPREFAMMDMMGGRGPMGGQGASSIIATEWARQDPVAAMAWASSLTTGKGDAMNAVVGQVAKADPRKAAEMISKMDAADRAGAYRTVAEQYGAMDFAEAQTWIRSLPADAQQSALESAIEGLSNKDPFEASRQLGLMKDGDAKDDLAGTIIGDLAGADTQAAVDLLKEQTSENAQRGAMRPLMPSLVAKNPIAALALVNSYQPGPVRDSAATAYVWSNSKGEPAELMQVAASITDEGERSRAMGIAAMRWMREDEAAAKAYVESSPAFSEEAKRRITSGQGMWGGGRGFRGMNR
jgi:hypothetical protein